MLTTALLPTRKRPETKPDARKLGADGGKRQHEPHAAQGVRNCAPCKGGERVHGGDPRGWRGEGGEGSGKWPFGSDGRAWVRRRREQILMRRPVISDGTRLVSESGHMEALPDPCRRHEETAAERLPVARTFP